MDYISKKAHTDPLLLVLGACVISFQCVRNASCDQQHVAEMMVCDIYG